MSEDQLKLDLGDEESTLPEIRSFEVDGLDYPAKFATEPWDEDTSKDVIYFDEGKFEGVGFVFREMGLDEDGAILAKHEIVGKVDWLLPTYGDVATLENDEEFCHEVAKIANFAIMSSVARAEVEQDNARNRQNTPTEDDADSGDSSS